MALLKISFIGFVVLMLLCQVRSSSSVKGETERYGSQYPVGEFKTSPTNVKVSAVQKSGDLLPEDSFGLGYSSKYLFGGIGLGGYGGYPGVGYGGYPGGGLFHGHHGYHHHHQPFGYHNPYLGIHKPHFGFGGFGKHFHHYGYNYLFGGYPRYTFGLHNGFY